MSSTLNYLLICHQTNWNYQRSRPFCFIIKKWRYVYLLLLTHQNIIVIVLEKYCAISKQSCNSLDIL